MAADKQQFDFDYVTGALNLIPLPGDGSAIARNYVSSLDYDEESDSWTLRLHGGEEFSLSDDDMIEFEQTLRDYQDKAFLAQVESYKASVRAQMLAAKELEGGVTQVIATPTPGFERGYRRN